MPPKGKKEKGEEIRREVESKGVAKEDSVITRRVEEMKIVEEEERGLEEREEEEEKE